MKKLKQILAGNKERAIVFSDQALVSGVNFVVGIIIARSLGIEEFGVYALGWTLVLFASSVHQAFIVMPFFSAYPKQADKVLYLRKMMGLQVLFTALIFVVCYVIAEWASGNNFAQFSGSSLSISTAASLYVFFDFQRRVLFILKRPELAFAADCVAYGLQPVFLLYMVYSDSLNLNAVLAIINILLALAIGVLFLLYKPFSQVTFFEASSSIKTQWKTSYYLVGTSFLQWFSGNFFILAAGGLIGPVAVGAIRFTQNLMGFLHVIFLALENIVPGRSAEILHHHGHESMLLYIRKISKQTFFLIALMILFLTLFREKIIGLLYGKEYLPYKDLVVAFSLLYLLIFAGTMLRFIIRSCEKTHVIFISYVVTSTLSFFSAEAVVLKFGIYGVMGGLFLTQFLSIAIYIVSLKKELKWALR